MAPIFRVVANWTGFAGAPGFTNLFFRNVLPGGAPTNVDDVASGVAAYERVHAFFTAIKGFFPDDVTVTINSTVDELDDESGALLGSVSVAAKPAIKGTNAGPYSAVTGGVISWTTGTVRKRRRIRGRTFIVPMHASCFTTGGRLDPAVVGVIEPAARAMAIGGVNSTFGVWARPTLTGATDGQWAECTGVKMSDLPAVLRSRRD